MKKIAVFWLAMGIISLAGTNLRAEEETKPQGEKIPPAAKSDDDDNDKCEPQGNPPKTTCTWDKGECIWVCPRDNGGGGGGAR